MNDRTVDATSVIASVRLSCSNLNNDTNLNHEHPTHDAWRVITEQVIRGQGKVLEASEQELICVFPSPGQAFKAARAIHRGIAESAMDASIGVRTGFFPRNPMSPGGKAGTDPLACASSLSLRATPGQIIACADVVEHMENDVQADIKPLDARDWRCEEGDDEPLIYQLMWQDEMATRMGIPTLKNNVFTRVLELSLRWRNNNLMLGENFNPLTIGRGAQADIIIESDYASRIHAGLSYLHSCFVLSDQSTNGTYVQVNDDAEVFLHDDELILRGTGCISLGRRVNSARGNLLYYKALHAEGS